MCLNKLCGIDALSGLIVLGLKKNRLREIATQGDIKPLMRLQCLKLFWGFVVY